MKRLAIGTEAYLHNGLFIATVATLSFLVLAVAPRWLIAGVSFPVIGFGAFLFALLFVVSASQRSQALDPAKSYLRLALVVWWSLLVSQEAFHRFTAEADSYAGRFSGAAYGEAAFWALAFLALLLIMPRPQYLRQAFSGSNKWLSFFAVVCLISAPFSSAPLYSLAWGFKLLLVVPLLLLCSAAMHDLDDIEAFFWANLWGFVIIALVPVARAFADPSTAFEGGRLNETASSPTGLSLCAGTLVLLSLTLNSLRNRTWLVGLVILGSTVMVMAGGKAGIFAGIASVALFFVLQKRVVAGFGWLLGVFVLGCIILAVTPLSTYLTSYQQSGELSTLTGRTELWRAVWPEIMQHPLVGHGYLASRFLSEEVEGTFPEAGHMHNGFIEALYSNGLVGLVILVGIHLVIVKKLWRALKGSPNRNAHLLAVGSWAIYVNLLINGLFNAIFGGRAGPPFMLLLGLVVVSEALRRNAHLPARLPR
ncbi:MAG: O-antigen ligase family protein [Acidobacteriia bacterium]|nr:O-antigen ligase family protein [Terriglobia bacterium]